MEWIGHLLGALSALGWSAFDVARKKATEGMSDTGALSTMNAVHVPVMGALFAAGALAPPGEGAPRALELLLPTLPEMTSAYGVSFALALGLNLVANLLFMRSVATSPLSLTTPYLAFTPVFTTIGGALVFSEIPSALATVGVCIVCAGAFGLNAVGAGKGALAPLRALLDERGSLYMLGVALLWSVSSLVDKSASSTSSPTFHAGAIALGLTVVYGAWRSATSRGLSWVRDETSGRVGFIVGAGLVSLVAYFAQLVAYEYTDVSHVETIKRAVGTLAALVAGHLVFREEGVAKRVVPAALMIIGVAMVLYRPT